MVRADLGVKFKHDPDDKKSSITGTGVGMSMIDFITIVAPWRSPVPIPWRRWLTVVRSILSVRSTPRTWRPRSSTIQRPGQEDLHPGDQWHHWCKDENAENQGIDNTVELN